MHKEILSMKAWVRANSYSRRQSISRGYIEKQDNHRMVGNVYKGKVENYGMQAAFVDVGYEFVLFYHFLK